MRICLVSLEYPPETGWGGVGTQTWVKARALAARGHEVHVLACSADDRRDLRTDVHDGVTVHRVHPPGYEFPVFGKPLWLVGYTVAIAGALHDLMEKHRFDVLDFPEFGGEGFAYQLDRTRWNWVPVVVQIHGSMAMFVEHMGWPERGSHLHEVGGFLEAFSLRNADAIMSCSGSAADIVARAYGLDRAAIDVVHCGVDTGLFTPAAAGTPLPDRPTVLFVGRLVGNKGAETIAEAGFVLREKYPDLRVVFVGEGSSVPDRIRERAAEERAEALIELPGHVPLDELPDRYRAAHVFCSPATYEGFGQTAIEAQACGCPAVVSSGGGGAEAVADGTTGFVVPPGDVAATARALDAILGDPAMRARMSAAALVRIRDYFSMDRYIDRVLAVYEKALARSRRLSDDDKEQLDWRRPSGPFTAPASPAETQS
jgi:glycosyltransferase involved in cell wall biosynthesis